MFTFQCVIKKVPFSFSTTVAMTRERNSLFAVSALLLIHDMASLVFILAGFFYVANAFLYFAGRLLLQSLGLLFLAAGDLARLLLHFAGEVFCTTLYLVFIHVATPDKWLIKMSATAHTGNMHATASCLI
jgi:hypothetical protein